MPTKCSCKCSSTDVERPIDFFSKRKGLSWPFIKVICLFKTLFLLCYCYAFETMGGQLNSIIVFNSKWCQSQARRCKTNRIMKRLCYALWSYCRPEAVAYPVWTLLSWFMTKLCRLFLRCQSMPSRQPEWHSRIRSELRHWNIYWLNWGKCFPPFSPLFRPIIIDDKVRLFLGVKNKMCLRGRVTQQSSEAWRDSAVLCTVYWLKATLGWDWEVVHWISYSFC